MFSNHYHWWGPLNLGQTVWYWLLHLSHCDWLELFWEIHMVPSHSEIFNAVFSISSHRSVLLPMHYIAMEVCMCVCVHVCVRGRPHCSQTCNAWKGVVVVVVVGGWPLHILPKTHDWHVCPISVFLAITLHTAADSNPQSKKADHQLILHKREPLKCHYMIHNTQYQ